MLCYVIIWQFSSRQSFLILMLSSWDAACFRLCRSLEKLLHLWWILVAALTSWVVSLGLFLRWMNPKPFEFHIFHCRRQSVQKLLSLLASHFSPISGWFGSVLTPFSLRARPCWIWIRFCVLLRFYLWVRLSKCQTATSQLHRSLKQSRFKYSISPFSAVPEVVDQIILVSLTVFFWGWQMFSLCCRFKTETSHNATLFLHGLHGSYFFVDLFTRCGFVSFLRCLLT